MSKVKMQTLAPAKEPSPPVAELKPPKPRKAAGRAQASPQQASSNGNGASHPTQAAGILTAPAHSHGAVSRAHTMTFMQSALGNTRLSRMMGATIQTKLTIGEPDDIYEREADRVAEMVTQPGPKQIALARSAIVQRQTASPTANPDQAGGASMEDRIKSPSGGQPLPESIRREMEPGLGTDFSHVRVHDSAENRADAGRLNAKAFTYGEHIWLGPGASASDRKLMAHELTHVVQQSGDLQRKPTFNSQQQEVAAPERSPDRQGLATASPTQFQRPVERPPLADTLHDHGSGIEPGLDEQLDERTALAGVETPGEAAAPDVPERSINTPQNLVPVADVETAATESGGSADISESASMPPESTAENMTSRTEAEEPATGFTTEPETSRLTAAPGPLPAPSNATLIQRSEDDTDGLLGSIRRRINSIVDGVRSGWDNLSEMAHSALEAISGQVGSLMDGFRNLIMVTMAGFQSVWAAIRQRATQLTQGLTRIWQGALSSVTGIAQAVGQAIMRLDANALRAAWGRLLGLMTDVNQRLQQAMQAVYSTIAGLWQGLRNRFNAVLSNLSDRARDLFNQLRSAAQGLSQRLVSAWNVLRDRASQMSGVLGGVLDALRSLVSRLISWGERIWNGIQQQWSALRSRVSGLLQQVRQRVSTVWQSLRQRMTSMWNGLQGLWSRLQQWVRQQVQSVIGGFRVIWNGIRSFNILDVINAITRYAPFLNAAREAAETPNAVMRPVAQAIASQIEAGMPAAAERQAREHAGSRGGGSTSPAQLATGGVAVQRTVSDVVIQRVPLQQPIDQSTLWGGFWEVLVNKWNEFWTHPVDNILHMLWEMVAFWETVPHDFGGLLDDLGRVFTRMSTAGLGFWRHLIDIPLIIWRRVNQILFDLYPLFLILSVLVGAIAGGVGGTVGGTILGFMAGGVGAAPGAGVGAGVGVAGGAGTGFGFALGVGEGLLASYVAAEVLSFIKAWADLSFVEQTESEQVEDLEQMVNSAIGLGIAAVLFLLSAIAGGIARGLLSKLKLRPGGAAARFIQGVQKGFRGGSPFRRGRGVRGGEGEEPPATRQRLSIQERLAEFFNRLRAAPRAGTAEEALTQLRDIMNQVEDELSGIPRKEPPPSPSQPDGRMYPPLDDFTTRNPDGSISARTRGHRIEIGRDGSITIRNSRTGNIDLQKPGR